MKTLRDVQRIQLRVLAITVAACTAAASMGSHLIYNLTDSLPHGFYWVSVGHHPTRGSLVAFPIPRSVRQLVVERKYLPEDAFIVKGVAALAGDHVCTVSGDFLVNGTPVGAILERDSHGRPLPHYQVCGVVPQGEVYVASKHPQSFDSRVFGPVKLNQLRGTVRALWTF